MSIYVKDLFQLDIFKNFKVVAGQNGLNRILSAAQVLDFEFMDGYENRRGSMFDKNSLVLSSLLFAKGREEALLQAVQQLAALGISAFAYKNVIYKQLPQEVLDFANAAQLPILEFHDEDAFFEDLIFAVMNLLKIDSNLTLLENRIQDLGKAEFSSEELEARIASLNPHLQPQIQAFYLKVGDENRVMSLLFSFRPPEKFSYTSIVSKYKKDLLLIFSSDKSGKDFQPTLGDALFYLGLEAGTLPLGISAVHQNRKQLPTAIEEAIQAAIVGRIQGQQQTWYNQIGEYQLLLPELHSVHVQNYMKRYLRPILPKSDEGRDLIKTAVQFVLAGGDLNLTCQRLFCHKNTVRYRVNKIHELLDPHSHELTFFEHLAVAIKIYLLNEYVH
ncbi:PucR family transcriptional regulator [Aminipila butyrica]|uniref:PucR family transcriptional regulator n=1 Tax=Aminipila butyrica TaxID=433296 RepID=A0A858BV05_9FIRM|nr:PucR family transcriptional regulator [Aminipila butyrica]QIB68760.1 PucR family transcriptional regulator [Aminipila butyrica]